MCIRDRGNTARERELARLHALTPVDPVIREDPDCNSSQDSEAHDGGEVEMDAAPTSPLSRKVRDDLSVHEGQSQQDEDEDAALDALFSPAGQQPSEANGADPATPVSDGPRTKASSRGKRKQETRDEDAAADAVDTSRSVSYTHLTLPTKA